MSGRLESEIARLCAEVKRLRAVLAQQAEPVEPITRLFGTLPVHDAQQAEPVEPVACPACEELGYVPLSEDGRSVFIDGVGEVPLAQQADPQIADRLARHGIPMPEAPACPDCHGIGYDASGQLCACQQNPSF